MFSITKWWKDFLERLAKASQEEYGDKPPSCCAGSEQQKEKEPTAAKGERK